MYPRDFQMRSVTLFASLGHVDGLERVEWSEFDLKPWAGRRKRAVLTLFVDGHGRDLEIGVCERARVVVDVSHAV